VPSGTRGWSTGVCSSGRSVKRLNGETFRRPSNFFHPLGKPKSLCSPFGEIVMPIMEMEFLHTRIIQLCRSTALANYAFLMFDYSVPR
jgi:hypothetical protein